jgi:hypothetical protein
MEKVAQSGLPYEADFPYNPYSADKAVCSANTKKARIGSTALSYEYVSD